MQHCTRYSEAEVKICMNHECSLSPGMEWQLMCGMQNPSRNDFVYDVVITWACEGQPTC